jgi:hypothetical protein
VNEEPRPHRGRPSVFIDKIKPSLYNKMPMLDSLAKSSNSTDIVTVSWMCILMQIQEIVLPISAECASIDFKAKSNVPLPQKCVHGWLEARP